MFIIKNLLKISLVVFIFFIFSGCKPAQIEEDAKEAFGYYAYNKGDSVKMIVLTDKDRDTSVMYVTEKNLIILQQMVSWTKFEDLNLYLVSRDSFFYDDYDIAKDVVFIDISALHNYPRYTYYLSVKVKRKVLLNYVFWDHINGKFYEQKKIDGKIYNSVYYLVDSVDKNKELLDYIYSSTNYGFIKLWNDTVTIKFER